MTPERWQQIDRVLQAALARPADERTAFLIEACGGDDHLRKEVESLLAFEGPARQLLETPPAELAADVVAQAHSEAMIGRTIGSYRIVRRIGAGGMGEVYLAEDRRLGRQVALKLLPAFFTQDPERVRRFQQEARAASALNHPNILTIYEIGETNNIHFIATEFVEGPTLSAKINGHPLDTAEVLNIATQIADALDVAHSKGIIHRDIKPSNIMLTERGQVKVLDFGLAKMAAERRAEGDSRLVAEARTAPGVVMGTVQYMSPEQALGREVDHRTDLFSLGVVMYEMTTAQLPFKGATASETIDRIAHSQPDAISRFNYHAPWELERIIRKCLEKDRSRRYQTARDLLVDLQNLKRDSASVEFGPSGTMARPRSWHERMSVMATFIAAGLVALAVVGFWLWRSSVTGSMPTATNATFKPLTDQLAQELFPSLSPNGEQFVYCSNASGDWDIYLQRVGGKNPINLTADSPADDSQPVFSPDGERIAFRSGRDGGGLFIMGATGESVKRITDFGFNPAWSPDGTEIVFADARIVDHNRPGGQGLFPGDRDYERLQSRMPDPAQATAASQLWIVNVKTEARRSLTAGDAVQPSWSPHGHRIAYWGRYQGGQRDIRTVSADGGEPVQVTDDPFVDWNPVWSPDGNYLYFVSDRSGSMNLWRIPVDERTGQVRGAPEPLTTPSPFSQHVSLSKDGRRLVYVQVSQRSNLQQVGFDPVRAAILGEPVWITQGTKPLYGPTLSPDGEWTAYYSGGPQQDIFVMKSDGAGAPRQLTDDSHRDFLPRWSPDSRRLAFYSNRSGRYEIWTVNADGSELRQLTRTSSKLGVVYPVWSPDGNQLAFALYGGHSFIMDLRQPWDEAALHETPPVSANPPTWFVAASWSPDGRTLAGVLGNTGQASPGIVLYDPASRRYEHLTDFGAGAQWVNDNRRLLFHHNGHLFIADRQTKQVRAVSAPALGSVGPFMLSRDNRLLLFERPSTEADIWLMTTK
jgi:serine/threonine protein kinase